MGTLACNGGNGHIKTSKKFRNSGQEQYRHSFANGFSILVSRHIPSVSRVHCVEPTVHSTVFVRQCWRQCASDAAQCIPLVRFHFYHGQFPLTPQAKPQIARIRPSRDYSMRLFSRKSECDDAEGSHTVSKLETEKGFDIPCVVKYDPR